LSTVKVTAERLTIKPHPNADALELAQVGLYNAVVRKGQFNTGDVALYIPEQAVLPIALIDELGLTGRLAGPEHNRVKAVRLRGELSQGIVCRPHALDNTVLLERGLHDERDFSADLGITKWVPPVPTAMSGRAYPAENLLPWIDIENIKRYPDLFVTGEPVVATEKVHGTCLLLTYTHGAKRPFEVSSKGLADSHLALEEDPANLYWKAVDTHDLRAFSTWLACELGEDQVGVFGEVYGEGVQDLSYGHSARTGRPGFVVFDVAVRIGVSGPISWLRPRRLCKLVEKFNADSGNSSIHTVPVLYEGAYDVELLTGLAEGRETLSGTGANLREGLVVRSAEKHFESPLNDGRRIAKFVSEAYLTRKGGTEYV